MLDWRKSIVERRAPWRAASARAAHVVERLAPVDRRLAQSQHVQVGSVEDVDRLGHEFLSAARGDAGLAGGPERTGVPHLSAFPHLRKAAPGVSREQP